MACEGKRFFNPNMQYVAGVFEALGYVAGGLWALSACLAFPKGLGFRV